jgi:hypothetical protein
LDIRCFCRCGTWLLCCNMGCWSPWK